VTGSKPRDDFLVIFSVFDESNQRDCNRFHWLTRWIASPTIWPWMGGRTCIYLH